MAVGVVAAVFLSNAPPISRELPLITSIDPRPPTPLLFRRPDHRPRRRGRLVALAESDGPKGAADGERPPPLSLSLRWRDLLDPDPENILAVGLTGLLAWASLQALAQLFFISLAIIVAALKYSFVAALLLFILITLL